VTWLKDFLTWKLLGFFTALAPPLNTAASFMLYFSETTCTLAKDFTAHVFRATSEEEVDILCSSLAATLMLNVIF